MDTQQVAAQSGNLRFLLNEWDPIGVAELVQDEYDCMIGPLLRRLWRGADRTGISAYLWNEMEQHFGLDPATLEVERMADRVVTWWEAVRARHP
ncbi:hypothetical protein AQ490_23650 [Wenjunlia vitaminophila]|uniref:Uncharacterized protein n=1 Tax=Wenjunlia vitaminophila TaxID=76728 RepID=A0A0T6LS83_WENVI|nr:hypothetical protein [Wenjunlia vitaminophila]KRV48856.1 hypothetical protein AQ490_23650 [Wenjunlia vitaminophila]